MDQGNFFSSWSNDLMIAWCVWLVWVGMSPDMLARRLRYPDAYMPALLLAQVGMGIGILSSGHAFVREFEYGGLISMTVTFIALLLFLNHSRRSRSART